MPVFHNYTSLKENHLPPVLAIFMVNSHIMLYKIIKPNLLSTEALTMFHNYTSVRAWRHDRT